MSSKAIKLKKKRSTFLFQYAENTRYHGERFVSINVETVQAKTNLPSFHQLKKKVRECVCMWVTPWLMTYLTTQAPVWIPGRGVCLKTTLLHSPCQSSFIVKD